MKFKIVLFAFISICLSTISAQTEETSSYELNWTGIEKWIADSTSINVISFAGAQYPAENRLPYFDKRISCDKAFSYQAELKNPVYIPVTNEENKTPGKKAVNSLPSNAQRYPSMMPTIGFSE